MAATSQDHHSAACAASRLDMKILFLAMTLVFAGAAAPAQTTQDAEVRQRLQQLEDKAALKNLVDVFSVLADKKDVQAQTLLFTEDATVDSISDGRPGSSFKGRKQIGDAFGAYLANFDTVYHINGQQTVEVAGDKATGTAYCLVVLIGKENGKTIRNTSGVIYNDEYVRRGKTWLIAKRVSNFTWRDRAEVPPPSAR
jgi:ketosteroid isomerase-like protein